MGFGLSAAGLLSRVRCMLCACAAGVLCQAGWVASRLRHAAGGLSQEQSAQQLWFACLVVYWPAGRPASLLVAKLSWLQPSPALLLIVVFAWPGKDEGDQLDKILSIMGQPTEASMPVSKWPGYCGLGCR